MAKLSQRLRNTLGDAAEDLEQMFEDQADSIQLRALESAELRFGARLDRSIDSLRSAMDRRFEGLRDNMDRKIDALRDDMDRKIGGLRDDMDRKFAAQSVDFDLKLDRRFGEFLVLLRSEIDARVGKALTVQTRWIAGIVVAQSVAILSYLALR
ncbi:MAG: apolipoprotein A1/A4/E family protein [Leptospirales bacterium]|nr:apolipoprotein A1/A4/E family protein [Leptospirales bacterium]